VNITERIVKRARFRNAVKLKRTDAHEYTSVVEFSYLTIGLQSTDLLLHSEKSERSSISGSPCLLVGVEVAQVTVPELAQVANPFSLDPTRFSLTELINTGHL